MLGRDGYGYQRKGCLHEGKAGGDGTPACPPSGIVKTGNKYSISGENYKTVQYDKLIPLLIEAIKEQQVMIEELQRSSK